MQYKDFAPESNIPPALAHYLRRWALIDFVAVDLPSLPLSLLLPVFFPSSVLFSRVLVAALSLYYLRLSFYSSSSLPKPGTQPLTKGDLRRSSSEVASGRAQRQNVSNVTASYDLMILIVFACIS